MEARLFEEYSANAEYRENAWGVTVKNLESLFKSVAERSEQGVTCDIEILRDDTLIAGPDGSPPPTEAGEAA